jgi:hypothetical protein
MAIAGSGTNNCMPHVQSNNIMTDIHALRRSRDDVLQKDAVSTTAGHQPVLYVANTHHTRAAPVKQYHGAVVSWSSMAAAKNLKAAAAGAFMLGHTHLQNKQTTLANKATQAHTNSPTRPSILTRPAEVCSNSLLTR